MVTWLISCFWSQWTLIFGALIYVGYKWSTATFDFFNKKNVSHDKPIPLLGNFKDIVLQREAVFNVFKQFYLKNRNKKFFGVYEMRNPILMVNSPDLIKQIAIKDFDNFLNHRVLLDEDDEPLFGSSLFSLKDQKWKDMRATLSPAFTGSKMRLMFQLVEECSQNAIQYLRSQAKVEQAIEMDLKDFYTRFTNDVIATCAFGIQINSLLEKDNEFYNMSKKATNFSGFAAFKFFLFATVKGLMKLFKVKLFGEEFSQYFHRLVLDTMRQRAEKGIIRPDMINLLMEARKGTLQANDVGKTDTTDGFSTVQESAVGQKAVKRNWSDNDLVAQCFLFFIAGFETSSVLMCFCAHELMENPDVQHKLIEEVDQVRKELAGQPLTYEVLQKMKYMDMVMSETLRKWPAAVGTDRVCNRACIIGDKDGEHVRMNPGETVMIPIVGLHHDPEYFPEPNKFDPERFSDENKDNIRPFTYLPFGIGPRNCIGSRFALMESKTIMFHLLSEFTFEPSPKTCRPLVLKANSFQLQPKNGFWLNFKPRS